MPTPFDRSTALRRLEDEEFDVLVVGGGITGVGCALDAASRGLRTALVERDDFSSGTSSKSSKLAHGGLRYLQQREFGLVYEALYERTIMLRNAPHLVHELPFLIPVLTRDGLMNPKIARALGSALWMYDLTGGVRSGKIHKRISKAQALEHMPTLRESNLASAYIYYDAQVDDSRLTVAVARTAAEHGAAIANHCAVVGLRKDAAGRVSGATVEADGRQFDVRARAVINAAGVWSDSVRAMDEGANPHSIRPAKGIHITVPWEKVRNDIATIVPVPKDRRSIFVVPWGDFTYIGTTDTDYDGDTEDPQCTPEDVRYCLDAMNLAMSTPLTEADVTGVWAGLRPLIAGGSVGDKTKDLSRKHGVTTSEGGVTTITGGKLTTYRRMAADTIDAVADRLGVKGRSRTKKLRLVGAEGAQPADEHLRGRFGSLGADVLTLAHSDADLAAPLVPGLPYLRAEAVYAVREEMAGSLADVLERRTRARILARDASLAAAPSVAALIGAELGWDTDRIEAEVAAYAASIAHERTVSDLPEVAL
ncbi:MAG: glycerol-3-phosphate dehydrogenase/oxidase [Actinomycetes bacterium]